LVYSDRPNPRVIRERDFWTKVLKKEESMRFLSPIHSTKIEYLIRKG
jgi:hypothetical protein